MTGHSVLAVPVPQLDAVVRARTERYDASFVSTDPQFGHAHLTLLGPWLVEPAAEDLATVARVVADESLFAFTLVELRQFPGGVLYLAPEPEAPFKRLAARLAAAFPQTLPYGGEFADSVPHLTLDHAATGVTLETLRAELTLPVQARAERVDLQWWANHDCHVRHTWWLG
jgi:2'-5' RNA ligase superfamily